MMVGTALDIKIEEESNLSTEEPEIPGNVEIVEDNQTYKTIKPKKTDEKDTEKVKKRPFEVRFVRSEADDAGDQRRSFTAGLAT